MDKSTNDYKRRKKIGQFFTQDILVDKISQLFKLDFKNKIIVEPSCGEGVFIDGIINNTKEYKEILAIDTDSDVLEKLKRKKYINVNLYNEDFLKFKFKQKVDVVIGNPPFNLKVPGFSDSTEAFISKSIDILNDNGEMILIVPNTVLRNKNYQNIRHKILTETKIVGIIDTRSFEFLGADIETIAIYLKKEKAEKQCYNYFSNNNIKKIYLEKNKRESILINNKKYYDSINSKIEGKTIDELFIVKRGNAKKGGLRGRNIDFYDNIYEMDEGNEKFIAVQNIAYRITANAIKGNLKNISDTVTMLIPKYNMSIKELEFIASYLNSSIVYYNLHTGCLNNSKLTIHIDKYYIDDIKIPKIDVNESEELLSKMNNIKKTIEISDVRNSFFYKEFNLEKEEVDAIESMWVAPKYKCKVGEYYGI